MSTIRNPASLGNILAATIPVDMGKLYFYDADETPLLAFTASLKKVRSVKQAKFNHLWSEPMGLKTAINNGAGYADSATSLVVDDGSIFSVNDIVRIERTGENVRVTAISTNTLTVTRGFGSVAAAAIVDNDEVMRIGSAFAEGASSNDPNMLLETEDYNFTQIFRKSVSVTRTAQASELYTGDELKKRIRNAQRDIKIEMERAALFGQRYINADSNNPIRTTRGLNSFITTNRFAVDGNLSKEEFMFDILPDVGKYGSGRKIIYCGTNMMNAFSAWGMETLQTYTKDDMLGFHAKEFVSPHQNLLIVRHRQLERDWPDYAFIVDPDHLQRAELSGGGLKYLPKRQANDVDGEKGEFLAEFGWDHTLEKTHAVLTGITGAA